jgi:hypothetical protein
VFEVYILQLRLHLSIQPEARDIGRVQQAPRAGGRALCGVHPKYPYDTEQLARALILAHVLEREPRCSRRESGASGPYAILTPLAERIARRGGRKSFCFRRVASDRMDGYLAAV